MNLTKDDKEIVRRAKREKFWELLTNYIEVKKEETKAGIISWVNEDMSKTKRNDRDIQLFKLERLDEIMNYPDEIINLIDNQLYSEEMDENVYIDNLDQ